MAGADGEDKRGPHGKNPALEDRRGEGWPLLLLLLMLLRLLLRRRWRRLRRLLLLRMPHLQHCLSSDPRVCVSRGRAVAGEILVKSGSLHTRASATFRSVVMPLCFLVSAFASSSTRWRFYPQRPSGQVVDTVTIPLLPRSCVCCKRIYQEPPRRFRCILTACIAPPSLLTLTPSPALPLPSSPRSPPLSTLPFPSPPPPSLPPPPASQDRGISLQRAPGSR